MDFFITRTFCVICNSQKLKELFENDYRIPQAHYLHSSEYNEKYLWMPYNVQKCENCLSYQIKYLADLDVLYKISHIQASSSLRNKQVERFSTLILQNPKILGIVEIGAGAGELSEYILASKQLPYYIVDPTYVGSTTTQILIPEYIENVDICTLPVNTLVISHTWEHFYEPSKIIQRIANSSNIEHVFMCHPDFNTYINKEPYTYNCLHSEHTFFVENEAIPKLFKIHGFDFVSYEECESYSVFFEFKRNKNKDKDITEYSILNTKSETMISKYFASIIERVSKINEILLNISEPVYIWPCSVHTITLFNFGLNYKRLYSILDNAPTKIGKYLYGYNIKCLSFEETVMNATHPITVIINGGCFNKEIIGNRNINVTYI